MTMLTRDALLRAYPQTPPQVQRRVAETLADMARQAAQTPPRRRAVRLRFATALALLLVLLAALGLAAGIHFGVFDFMAQLFDQTGLLPQAEELVQNQLSTKKTAHTTITLSQAVYDGGNLRLVYSVRVKGATAPLTEDELNDPESGFRKALAADGVSPWGCDWFYVDGAEYTMTGGSTSATLPGGENGEALCYMDIYLASAGIVPQGDFRVGLPIIRRDGGGRETLDFTVRATAEAARPLVRQVKGAAVTVQSVFLSPVRAYVNLHVQIDDGISPLQGEVLLADWKDAVLADGQGNSLAECSEFQTLAETPGVSGDYSYTFYPTDAAEVYISPTVISPDDRWYADMEQAIRLKPALEK